MAKESAETEKGKILQQGHSILVAAAAAARPNLTKKKEK